MWKRLIVCKVLGIVAFPFPCWPEMLQQKHTRIQCKQNALIIVFIYYFHFFILLLLVVFGKRWNNLHNKHNSSSVELQTIKNDKRTLQPVDAAETAQCQDNCPAAASIRPGQLRWTGTEVDLAHGSLRSFVCPPNCLALMGWAEELVVARTYCSFFPIRDYNLFNMLHFERLTFLCAPNI